MARRLRIDLADLELAFESSDAECSYYLDLDSGEVLFVTDEMRSAFEELSEAAEIRDIEFTEALAESGLADWMKDAVAQVAVVEERFGTTVIDVPTDESSAAFRDMEAFAASVGDVRIQARLIGALSGGRPFRRFKDAIATYEREEQRWFAFRDERLRKRVLDWLADEDIELIEASS